MDNITDMVGDTIEAKYSTSQVAKIIGVHPNTVRKYEDWGLIGKAPRKANGYRVFSDVHIDQFRLARIAFEIELIHSGLRKTITRVVKLAAEGKYDKAVALANTYITIVEFEKEKATEVAEISNELMNDSFKGIGKFFKRKEVSDILDISMDTLRNWEMNGLIKIKRKENGYRIYDYEDIKNLKIIRLLRCANYSLSSILRLMSAKYKNKSIDTKQVLNTPNVDESIVSVCDKLIISLNSAKENAEKIIEMLNDMNNKYTNPPL